MEFPVQDLQAGVDATTQNILDSLRRIVRALRISSRLYEKDFGLTVTQLFVMRQLQARPCPLSMNELAQATLTHQSSVSVVVSRLVERGLVERIQSREDARRAAVSLTPSGKRLLDSVARAGAGRMVQERLVAAVKELGEERGRRLSGLLKELVQLAGFDSAEPGMFEE